MKHADVVIATPGRSLDNNYVTSLLQTMDTLRKKKISYVWANRGSSHVALAREATLMNDDFMDITNSKPLLGKTTYKKIIWIDSDMSWTPEDFLKLYEAEEDIVSGIYLNDQRKPMFSHSNKETTVDLIKSEKIFEITHCGFGFVAIKQGVYESIPRPWFGTEYAAYKKDDLVYPVPYGEDYSFCVKARKAGYKIFLDPTVQLTHHKVVSIKL
jgi:hypothetical protein